MRTQTNNQQTPRVTRDGTLKKRTGPPAVDFGEATKHFFIRHLPVRVREAAKLEARMRGLTLGEFTVQALEEKLARSHTREP
jgi:hypothetical protein